MHYSKLLKTNSTYNANTIKETEPNIELPETELSDDEIAEVLSELMRLQEEYFSDIPLAKELCKQFMWNIPHDAYKAFIDAKLRDEPLILNPIALFYIFCTDNVGDAMGKFISILLSSLNDTDDAYNRIAKLSDEYDELMSYTEEDEEEEEASE